MNLKQFKLTNDDEVICEVVEVDVEAEDESGGIVIRKALKIDVSEDYENEFRYYSFKPLIAFQDRIEELIVMNVGHIICETLPSRTLAIHYARAIKELEKTQDLKKDMDIEKWLDEIDGLEENELNIWVKNKLEELREEDNNDIIDSDSPNIIQFNPRGSIH